MLRTLHLQRSVQPIRPTPDFVYTGTLRSPFFLSIHMTVLPNIIPLFIRDAVNEMLGAVGQAPVNTLEQSNPDVALAYATLMTVSREVQAEGWTFNKEYHYDKLKPDAVTKHITLPTVSPLMLQVDLSDNHKNTTYDSVIREGKLYDREHHTFEWDYDPLLDITWLFDLEDLPRPISDHIIARACAVFASRIVGDQTQYQILIQKDAQTRALALEYECSQGDYTFFGHPEGGDFYTSYQPYNALLR